MITVDLFNICTICALQKNQFAFERYCIDCWEAMADAW